MNILLLTDYRGRFYSSTKFRGAGFNLQKLKKYFKRAGYELDIRNFLEIDFRKENFKSYFVLYQSSEDPNLYYKDYIEDVLLGLYLQGATLIPEFAFFRAHHNKVFMEFVRDIHGKGLFDSIKSKSYGTLEDFIHYSSLEEDNKYVLKTPNTSGSRGVYKVIAGKKGIRLLKKISQSFSLKNIEYGIRSFLENRTYTKISNHRKKFTIQNYIDNIKGDYRVIVYGDKYYVVYRENRDHDFRASGSKKFDFLPKFNLSILDFSEKIFNVLNVPYIALDIGLDETNNQLHLFEFQALSFGQGGVEFSKGFYKKNKINLNWEYFKETPNIEQNLVTAVTQFLNR